MTQRCAVTPYLPRNLRIAKATEEGQTKKAWSPLWMDITFPAFHCYWSKHCLGVLGWVAWQQQFTALSCGGWTSEVQVWAGLAPPEGCDGKICSRPPPWHVNGRPVTSSSPPLCVDLGPNLFLSRYQLCWMRAHSNDLILTGFPL